MLASMHEEAQGGLVPTLSQVHHCSNTALYCTVQECSTVLTVCTGVQYGFSSVGSTGMLGLLQ